MTPSLLRSLFTHAEWANARVLESLRQGPDTDPQALEQYAHLLAAEHVWLARIEGRGGSVAIWPVLTLEQCVALANENAQGYARLLASESDESLLRDVVYANSAGNSFTSRVAEILAHVAMHGAYHRGQVSLMLRRGGLMPAPTDYIAFVRGQPTAAAPGVSAG